MKKAKPKPATPRSVGRPKNPGGAGVKVGTTLAPAVVAVIDELPESRLASRSKMVAELVGEALRARGLLK